ncbi:hypothetical protein MY10362_009811 [Beauveria mimosiformis]
MNKLLKLNENQLRAGLITYSTGNHGVAIAKAAMDLTDERGYAIPVHVVINQSSLKSKRSKLNDTGAQTIRINGSSMIDCRTAAYSRAKEHGYTLIESFDRDVMIGQATASLEISQQIERSREGRLDSVIVPCGGGGLATGTALLLKGSNTSVFAAEPLCSLDRNTCCRSILDSGLQSHVQLVPLPLYTMESKIQFRILLIGQGGREHALALRLSAASSVESIIVVPGNSGTCRVPKTRNLPLEFDGKAFEPLLSAVHENEVNLVIPTQESHLIHGIVDFFSSGHLFMGAICIDFILTASGPIALEYDVRFGDPESQALFLLISRECDFAKVLMSCTNQTLHLNPLILTPIYAVAVVAVSDGYPEMPKLGFELTEAMIEKGVFHSGLQQLDGKLIVVKGRVFAVCEVDATLQEAANKVYARLEKMQTPHLSYRKDIGLAPRGL